MKIKTLLISNINNFFEQRNFGPGERITMPLKYLLVGSMTVVTLFIVGSSLWPDLTFVYIWLFLLSMWAFLHVKKSVGTWQRFDEIDQRDSDFAEEIDARFEALQKELKTLKASLKPVKDPSSVPSKETRKRSRSKKSTKPKKAVKAAPKVEPGSTENQ